MKPAPVLVWFFRIASVIGIIATAVAIGVLVRRGDRETAAFLVFPAAGFAVLAGLSWTGWLFTLLDAAKHHVQGVEGDQRHEWYSFKGRRVRVFLDANQQPWFALNEIALILSVKVDKKTFQHYGPHEYGVPKSAGESCLSESGLRHLIKYSPHPEAGALRLWLEREVLAVLRKRLDREHA